RQGKLGIWVSNQRAAYMAGSLARDRIERLNSIGFKWALREAAPWETRFDELVQYKAKRGHSNVPRSQGKLGVWVCTQRSAYMAGSLTKDRIDRLSGIGFEWALQDPTVPWETRFDELVQYTAKHGDCNVPWRQGKLGIWAYKQRANYKKGKLSQDRINRLNGIGFDWTPPIGGSRKRKIFPAHRIGLRRERRGRHRAAQMLILSLLGQERKPWAKALTWHLRLCQLHPVDLNTNLGRRALTKSMRLVPSSMIK
ncbi:hypothetical protein THAOC_37294, partial [Thalassiosira oceanica]